MAQVGHDPSKSPYRDILYDQNLTAYASYFDGSGGTLGIGVHDGWMYGIRFQLRANRFISFGLGGELRPRPRAQRHRPVRGGRPPIASPGPVQIHVWIPEGLLQFNFTANKSWHRIAPYAGIGLGAGFSSTAPNDSIYRSSVRFVFTPYAGTRIYLANSPGAAPRGPHAALQDLVSRTSTTTVSSRSSAPAASGSRRAGSSRD